MERYDFLSDGISRIDVFLAEKTGFTRSRIKKLIEEGAVTAGGETVKKSGSIVPAGLTIEVIIEE